MAPVTAVDPMVTRVLADDKGKRPTSKRALLPDPG